MLILNECIAIKFFTINQEMQLNDEHGMLDLIKECFNEIFFLYLFFSNCQTISDLILCDVLKPYSFFLIFKHIKLRLMMSVSCVDIL